MEGVRQVAPPGEIRTGQASEIDVSVVQACRRHGSEVMR